MPQTCKVCCHSELEQISQDRAQGHSLRFLARKYGLTKSAINRHAHHSAPIDHRFMRAMLKAAGEQIPVRGNPDKTKPYRWKPGQSGNPRGRRREKPRSELNLLRDLLSL